MAKSTKRAGYKAADVRRAEIVEATIAIIAEKGLAAWKTALLARRVGVAEPTLFRHFGSKEAILQAAVRHETREMRRRLEGYRGEGSAWDRATGMVRMALAYFEETGGGPLVIVTGQVIRVSPAIRREVVATVQLLRGRLTELFQAALAERGYRGPVSADALADMALAIVQSCGLRWIIAERQFPLRQLAEPMLALLAASVPAGHSAKRSS